MVKTALKKLTIKKFRALNDVTVEFGTHITAICGKNGTSKSSILGIAAQIFSFERDYAKNETLEFQTITGEMFKSAPREHFRFSEKYDVPGSLDVAVELHDAYTGKDATAELELAKRTQQTTKKAVARPVVRKNSTVLTGNTSRNFTHPVIFLSLNRLMPIAKREYQVQSFDYLSKHKQRFIDLNNELLNKTSSYATGTGGTINSAVAHATNYDQDSVSAGEDNAGQIILALMSFCKLKEEYLDYKGGLLLIDEADAGLFPAAQAKLLDIFERECSNLNLQVVVTTHSPVLIEEIHRLSTKYPRKFKTVYLSDTFGPVKAQHDVSWPDISADLATKVVRAPSGTSLPHVNVYFEDREGLDFFNTLISRHPGKKFIKPLSEVSLGCSNYIQLVKIGIPEFRDRSLIVLDGDAELGKAFDSILLLPGTLPPDQLLFEFLYNLPPEHDIWKNDIKFTRPVLTKNSSEIISALSITTDKIDLKALVTAYQAKNGGGKEKDLVSKRKLREIFKAFYNSADVQAFLSQKRDKNPWKRWIVDNLPSVEAFREHFGLKLRRIMERGYKVDSTQILLSIKK
ncbi:MAG: AAA family ATPase [Sterolibacterium sp.]